MGFLFCFISKVIACYIILQCGQICHFNKGGGGVAYCRQMSPQKPTKIKVHFDSGRTRPNNRVRSSRHMHSFVPCNVSYILLFPLLFPCVQLSLTLPLFNFGGCCVLISTPLCYFCTEIRRILPFRSQSHISVEFFWHRKQKRALEKISISQPIFIRRIGHPEV